MGGSGGEQNPEAAVWNDTHMLSRQALGGQDLPHGPVPVLLPSAKLSEADRFSDSGRPLFHDII